MLTKDEETYLQQVIGIARSNLERDGGLMACAILFNRKYRNIEIVGMPYRNDREKEMSAAAVKDRARKHRADMLLLLNEGWALREKAAGYAVAEEVRPSQHPDREEVVLFQVELPGPKYLMAMVPIVRDEGKPPTFGEVKLEALPDDGRLEGTFANLLPQNQVA